MSAVWDCLLPAAMVGAERQAMAPLAIEGETGDLLRDIVAHAIAKADSPALALLRVAGALTVMEAAGAVGRQASSATTPSAAESRPAMTSQPALALIEWALRDAPQRLQFSIFAQLGAGGWRLPHALLPTALELARRATVLRPPLSGVLGERGVWLAGQNKEWQFAAGVATTVDAELLWAEGSFEQRYQLLKQERQSDAPAARVRLTLSLRELPAKERADLAQLLGANLSMADEDLLNTLLADRSRDVRQVALGLLVRLGDSAHAQRAVQRMATLLKSERKLTQLFQKHWVIDAPQAPVAASNPAPDTPKKAKGVDLNSDGIESERPKHETLGERAWLLYQWVRQVPLAWWQAHCEMTPEALLKWAEGTDWTEALLRGWNDVALLEGNLDWCEALLDRWPHKVLPHGRAQVLATLPLARREKFFLQDLHQHKDGMGATLGEIMAACPLGETLSAGFSASLYQLVLTLLQNHDPHKDYWLRHPLPELFCVLHAHALRATGDAPGLAAIQSDSPSVNETLHLLQQIMATRTALSALSPLLTLSTLENRTPS